MAKAKTVKEELSLVFPEKTNTYKYMAYHVAEYTNIDYYQLLTGRISAEDFLKVKSCLKQINDYTVSEIRDFTEILEYKMGND